MKWVAKELEKTRADIDVISKLINKVEWEIDLANFEDALSQVENVFSTIKSVKLHVKKLRRTIKQEEELFISLKEISEANRAWKKDLDEKAQKLGLRWIEPEPVLKGNEKRKKQEKNKNYLKKSPFWGSIRVEINGEYFYTDKEFVEPSEKMEENLIESEKNNDEHD